MKTYRCGLFLDEWRGVTRSEYTKLNHTWIVLRELYLIVPIFEPEVYSESCHGLKLEILDWESGSVVHSRNPEVRDLHWRSEIESLEWTATNLADEQNDTKWHELLYFCVVPPVLPSLYLPYFCTSSNCLLFEFLYLYLYGNNNR